MGFFDSIESMATQAMSGGGMGDQAKVAGGFVQAVEEHPGGLGAVMQQLQNSGLDQHVQSWTQGDTSVQATPDQVGNSLSGTGLIEKAAERAGVSPEVAKVALAAILPMIMAHMAPQGQAAPQGSLGGMMGGLLQRIL